MKRFAIAIVAILFTTSAAPAENGEILVKRTSANHTKIVIHNTSPEAYRKRNEYAREAQRRLEEKRRRKHELELARIEAERRRAEAETAEAERKRQEQPKVYQKKPHQPAAFMNGGRPTMGVYGGFNTVGIGAYGYRYNYAPRPVYAFAPRNCPPRVRYNAPRVIRNTVCRPTRRAYRPARANCRVTPRVSRGRRCR